MVEGSSLPRCRVVAVRAGLRELRRFMIGIHGRGVIGSVAGNALSRSPLVNAVFMAIYTSQRSVTTRQRELRVCRMVETRTLPRCRCMTQRTILRESGRTMVWILRAVVVTEMAGHTFLGFSQINTVSVAISTGK